MMVSRNIRILLSLLPLPSSLLALTLVAGCANPVPPRGGPRDTTPPSLRRSTPEADAVNVPTNTRIIRLEFTEYVERGSFVQALSLTPAFERRLEFDWDGRAVEIALPDTLRDNTTYIVTVDATFSDAHGVSLNEPLSLAFSTGPRINQGKIAGRIVTPSAGAAAPKIDVYAYPVPDTATRAPHPLPERPAYRTQTGEDGAFTFSHMREQDYFVIGVQDANRNRLPDRQESFAAPPRLRIPADSVATEVPVPWLLARVDTVAPSPQRVRSPSNRRLVLQFNEPVRLRHRRTRPWTLRDSMANTRVPIQSVYQAPGASNAITLRTAPMRPRRHRLTVPPATVADTLHNAVAPDTLGFLPAEASDTVRTRFRTFLPQPSAADTAGVLLLPDVPPRLRFNQPPDSAQLHQAVTAQSTSGPSRTVTLTTEDGTTYRLAFDPPLNLGKTVTVAVRGDLVAGVDTAVTRRYRRISNRQLGGLEGQVVLDTTTVRVDTTQRLPSNRRARSQSSPRPDSLSLPFVVELIPTNTPVPMRRRNVRVRGDSTFVFDQLPDGSFRFRAFLDRNRNNRWDPGTIVPYRPPEPLAWITQPVDSRPRWTNVLPEPLRIVVLNDADSGQE